MRSMWSGTVSFGMVSVPVKMYKATENGSGSTLHLLCKEHLVPISKPNLCSQDGKRLATHDVVHGAYRNGGWVVIEDDDLHNLPLKTLHTIDVDRFVPRSQVPMRLFANGIYYLAPDDPKKLGDEAYAILRDALNKTGTYAIAKIGMREKEQLVALSGYENVILLTTMTWPSNVRKTTELAVPAAMSSAKLPLAISLVQGNTEDWDATKYSDEYAPALLKLIEAKQAGKPVVMPVTPPKTTDDLMDQLKKSVAASTKKPRRQKKAS